MNSKEYVMPDGKKAVFEYDHDGIGKITIEAMDMLMGLIADGRKRGKWIETCDTSRLCSIDRLKCSECGAEYLPEFAKRYDFCPKCGADMREREDE